MSAAMSWHHQPVQESSRVSVRLPADLLTPQTGAYYEIWLDGKRQLAAKKIHMKERGSGTEPSSMTTRSRFMELIICPASVP